MNKKQLINSLIILVILSVLSFFTFRKHIASWKRGKVVEKAKLIENIDLNNVAKIAITTDSDSLALHKNDNGKWCVKERSDYPANFKKLSDFLVQLTDIDIVNYPHLVKSQFPSLKLVAPEKGKKDDKSGTTLTLSDKNGKILFSLLIGDKHMPQKETATAMYQTIQPDGCYVIIDNSDRAALINNALATVNPDPKKWIERNFFKIPDILSVSLADKTGKELWTIYRTALKAPWALKDIKKDDKPLPRPMMEASSAFANIAFDDVLSADTQDFTKAETVTIKTVRGLVYKIKIMPEDKKYVAKCAISIDPESFDIKPAKDEKPEDTKKREANIAKKKALLQKELEKQQIYTQWVYKFPKYKIEKVLKTKKELYRPAIPKDL